MAPSPAVSVVMPAHNEEGLLAQTVAELSTALGMRDWTYELLIVENGSTDDTAGVGRRCATDHPSVRVLSREQADYGAAMRMGILAARAPVVVVFDVDYYDADFIDRVLPDLTREGGPAIVVGSKRAPGTVDTRPWPRRAVTAAFSMVLRTGFGLRVSDTHGMKGMRREQVEALVERCRFGTDLFDTELVLRADRAGLAIAEVPVTVEERRPSRSPIARRIARTLLGLFRLRVLLWRER